MIKKIATIFIAVVMMVVGLAIMANGQDINTSTYVINIATNEDDSFSVTESLTVDVTSSNTLVFWIQDGATNVSILINSETIEPESIVGNSYSCNTSGLDIASIQVTYILDESTSGFVKTFQYNTTSITISFDGREIYTGSSITAGSSLNVTLQKPVTSVKTETFTTTKYEVPTWYYLIIVVLIILVLLSFVFPSKKQKTTKKKETTTGSEELLSTKKTLLMEILKDIEKQHRAKQISDDTYHKLKEQYKQEAVEAMKKLEDVKSKVK